MSTTRQSSAKNLTKKENLSDQALVAGVSVDIGTPGADLLNSLPSEPQAKFKNKKATDAELNKEEQQDSASNLKVADVELTEVVMVDATSVVIELTADVKKDCKINSKGVEECSDGGAGWWWAAGLPLLALGGGGGGGGAAAPAVVTPVTTSNYRHEDFVQNRSDLDDDVLVIDNTSNSIVQVFLDGGEHDEEGTWQASESNSWDSSNWDAQRDILVTKIADLGTAEDLLAADQAVLDPLLVDLADVEDILDAAQADLDALPVGDSGIAAAQAAVDAAQADVDTAQAAVDAAQADVDTAQAAVDAAEGDVTTALENLITELNDSDDNFEGAAIWSATVLDLQAAIDDGDDSAVEGLVEDLLVVLQDVDTEYLQAINFEGSDNIRDFRLFVENSDTVELDLDFSAALDLTSILVDVSEDSEIYMSGGGTLVSVVGLDNLDITINISDNGRIEASGGGTLVAVSGGDNLDIAINVTDGGRITLLDDNNSANLVNAAGDNINVNLTVDDATLNFSGGSGGSPAIFVAGDDSDVNVEFINDSGITVSQQGEDSNFVYIDGNQSVVNFTIDETNADFNLSGGGYLSADREFSGGQYNSSIIEAGSSIVAVSGDDATINFTVENNSNLYVSGGENISSVIAVEGDNANITVTSLNNNSGGIMLSGGGDVVNVIGHNASVHLVVGNDAEGETYSGSSFIQTQSADHSDIVRIFGNDALVDIDMSRNSEIGVYGSGGDVVNITGDDATIDVNIEALDENGSSYILLGNYSGGSLVNDPKNIFAINGDDATVNLDALIESGNLDIRLSGGDAIDILGDRANVTINLTAQLDENGPVLNDYNQPDIDIHIHDGGDFVHVTGDDAVVNITATANVDVQDPDPSGEIIDFRIDGSGASVVTVEGDDAEINLTLVGGVDIDGFEIAQVYGDNASVTLTANDSMVLGSSDQFLDIDVSGGISVFGNNASVAFNATGTIVQNQIEWDDDQSLVSISTNDSVLDLGSDISVAIDNAWMSGGFIAEINGNNAQVTVDLREVEGYTGGVKLNGNNSDIEFIADSSEMRLDGAGFSAGFSGGGLTVANDVAAQFLSIDGDDNDYRFVFNDINSLFIEPSVDIFEVNGVGNSGSIVVSNSTFNTSGGFGEDTHSVDQANFLAVYGDDNTSLITLNNSSMDFSQGSFITVDGNNNDTTLNIIKSDLYLSGGSFGEDTVIATELFSIDGNDNSLIVNVTSPSASYDSYLKAASDYSEVSGNNNTIDVNFLRNGDGDLGLEIQGNNNTLNLNFDKQELNAQSTVTFDLIEANSTEINIDGKRTKFAIGWANGNHNHDGSFIDGDDTVINIDLENNSIMALDTTLATGVNLDTTVNIDSDDSVFALEFYVENGHTLDINLNGVDQNSLFNNSNDLSSYLELITDADGVINITNQPNVDAIDTIIYGSGTVDLEVSNVHNVGNYDHIYIDDSRHLDVYDFEVEYDEIHLATNLYAGGSTGGYGNTAGVNWFDLDVYAGNYDLLQDVADFYYENYGGAVLFTDSGAAPTFNPGTDFDGYNSGLDYFVASGGSGATYEQYTESLETLFGTNIYYMSWDENEEDSLGDLSIYKWLDNNGYAANGAGGYIDDPYEWTLMATIHDIGNPATFYSDGISGNNYVYDYDNNYGTQFDDHYNNNISGFTTVDSYLDRWTVYGV